MPDINDSDYQAFLSWRQSQQQTAPAAQPSRYTLEPIQTCDDLVKAIRQPEYAKDSRYRDAVLQAVATCVSQTGSIPKGIGLRIDGRFFGETDSQRAGIK